MVGLKYSLTHEDSYRRLSRTSVSGASDIDVVYDDRGRIAALSNGEFRWLLRLETISTADGLVTIEYVWGKDISGSLGGAAGIGGLLYTKINGVIYVPQYDAYGNIISYCDAVGNIVASYTYDAFGRTIALSGALADVFAFRYSTKYFDRETGFYYYGKRYYSPALRRWLTRDPIGEEGGVNLYEFCECNAIGCYDTVGEFAIKVVSSVLKEWWIFDWQEEVEVKSVEDIAISEIDSASNVHGLFDIPSKEKLSFSGCDLKISVSIKVRDSLIESPKHGVCYYYRPHSQVNYKWQGGHMKSSDGSPIPRDAVLSHEKGHAKSFLDVAMRRFRSAVKKYSSKRLEELSASEISDIRTAYEDSCNEAMDDSCVKSNSATFDWFKSRGIKLKIYH